MVSEKRQDKMAYAPARDVAIFDDVVAVIITLITFTYIKENYRKSRIKSPCSVFRKVYKRTFKYLYIFYYSFHLSVFFITDLTLNHKELAFH